MIRGLLERNITELREIQKRAIKKGLFFGTSMLVCAPSGSGKTLIGELCAVHTVFQRLGKAVYLVPFKALAMEKYDKFKQNYKRFGVDTVLSIGDIEINEESLKQSDLIVTTYEKLDSILRNCSDRDWIFNINTVVIDEIHVLGEDDRGPRLESLIVRLNEFLGCPQLISLSATVANPKFFNSWLTSLGNKTVLIKSDERPVPLKYSIKVSPNKQLTIKQLIKSTLKDNGQGLVFLNRRKDTSSTALSLCSTVKSSLSERESRICIRLSNALGRIKGSSPELRDVIRNGVAFHHAGLLAKEKSIVETFYRRKILKVICCTTTLSAGINIPARLVIVKNFKKYITSGYNIRNFSEYYENGDGFSYFKPFSANEVFQMLGRAGRPGLDPVGYGVLLASNIEDKMWLEDHYFTIFQPGGKLIPKYSDLKSSLNDVNTLKEQVLLRIYEAKRVSMKEITRFFEKTYFWFYTMGRKGISSVPIEQMLMIQEVSPNNLLKLHSNPSLIERIKAKPPNCTITQISPSKIEGNVRTDFGIYQTVFHVISGIDCSCGWKNTLSDGFGRESFGFEFCEHITAMLSYLVSECGDYVKKRANDIIPKSVKNQYVLTYLLENGLVCYYKENTFICSQFGKLIVRLYLTPASGVLIREQLEHEDITNFQELLKLAYEVLQGEGRVRGTHFFEPIMWWADEEPLDYIAERFNIMPGDLHSVRTNIERILNFISIIAEYLAETSSSRNHILTEVKKIADVLKVRVHHGVREELFDLVKNLPQISRVRGRMLYSAGYSTAKSVRSEKPYMLHRKTGLSIRLCKKLTKSSKE